MHIFDAGALIAAERGDPAMWRRIKACAAGGRAPVTSAAVLAQVWRADPRHVRLSRLVAGIEVVELTTARAKAAGRLLAAAGTSDVVDAALILTAGDQDIVYTSDPSDLAHLAAIRGVHVDIVAV